MIHKHTETHGCRSCDARTVGSCTACIWDDDLIIQSRRSKPRSGDSWLAGWLTGAGWHDMLSRQCVVAYILQLF